jgi:hypothetical protein
MEKRRKKSGGIREWRECFADFHAGEGLRLK